jgi:hypothetical protein
MEDSDAPELITTPSPQIYQESRMWLRRQDPAFHDVKGLKDQHARSGDPRTSDQFSHFNG